MLRINYRAADLRAELRWDSSDELKPWLGVIRRLALDQSDTAAQEDALTVSLPWWSFVALRSSLFEVFNAYHLAANQDISVGPEAAALLRRSTRNIASYDAARNAQPLSKEALLSRLSELNFSPTRKLSSEQVR